MIKTGQFTIDDATLRVRVEGDGSPPLLMMNGWGANLETFDPLVDALQQSRKVVRFDPPGIGGTPLPPRPYRLSTLAGHVAALLDELDIDLVDVLGYSWGGTLAQAFALAYPERVNRLVLVATSPGVIMVPAWPTIIPAFLDRRWLTNALQPSRYFSREFFSSVGPRLFGGQLRENISSLLPALSHIKPPTLRTLLWQALGGATFTSLHRLHLLHQPTLILAGTDDPVINPLNALILRALLPNSALHWIEGGGHLFPVLRTRRCATLINNFLEAGPKVVPFSRHRRHRNVS